MPASAVLLTPSSAYLVGRLAYLSIYIYLLVYGYSLWQLLLALNNNT